MKLLSCNRCCEKAVMPDRICPECGALWLNQPDERNHAMSTFNTNDIDTLECDEEASREEEACALQRAINSGMWGLQGSYGRAMMGAIEAGMCMLGEQPARDYYGNRIPSRTEVKEGTKGSRAFVVRHRGEDWAAMLDEA